MGIRINIGCGRTPTNGWLNLDNSPAIKLARYTAVYMVANALGFLSKPQLDNIEWNKKNKIKYADAAKKNPLPNSSAECIYSSHMAEHLSRDEITVFLREAFRVLEGEGVLRIAVPDLRIAIDKYLRVEDADLFMKELLVSAPAIKNWAQKIGLFFSGYRHHQWMYDGKSLEKLLASAGFTNVIV